MNSLLITSYNQLKNIYGLPRLEDFLYKKSAEDEKNSYINTISFVSEITQDILRTTTSNWEYSNIKPDISISGLLETNLTSLRPASLWLDDFKGELYSTVLVEPAPKKKLSIEIVKLFSANEYVSEIYISRDDTFLYVDVVLNKDYLNNKDLVGLIDTEIAITDEFEYEIFEFNFYNKNTYIKRDNAVLIY